ncbi:MAG: hypothetical protein BWY76_00016 [bacterium ADurb.Bin429]|nr:MAG: hypothetical protein BWY76_00016 [bacterium ADurb.Bin429]
MPAYQWVHATVEVAKHGYQCVSAIPDAHWVIDDDLEAAMARIAEEQPGLAESAARAQAEARYKALRERAAKRVLTTVDTQRDIEQRASEWWPRHWRSFPTMVPSVQKDPMQDTHLARRFAKLAEAVSPEDAIVAFANDWGFLGGWTRCERVSDTRGTRSFIGESVAFWQEEARDMALALRLLDLAAGKRKPTELQKCFRWLNGRVDYTGGEKEEYVAHYVMEEGLTESLLEKDDLRAAAKRHVQHLINERLQYHTTASVQYAPDRGQYEMHATFTTLRGALWLQCLNALTGGVHWRVCALCGKDYQVGGEEGRSPKSVYCSDMCNYQAYYARGGKEIRKKRYLEQQARKASNK